MVLQHYIMFEAKSGSKAVVLFFSLTSITQEGTSQGQITSRHLKALQLSPEIVTAQSKLWTKLNCPFLWPLFSLAWECHPCSPACLYSVHDSIALRYRMSGFCLSFCNWRAVLPLIVQGQIIVEVKYYSTLLSGFKVLILKLIYTK